jgi:hypothetical protein
MSDFIDSPSPLSTPASVPDRPVCTPEDVTAGKALAVLSYVFNFFHLPFFVVPLIMRSDRLSLYHAKQCLMLWLTVLVMGLPLALVALLFTAVTMGLGLCIVIPFYFALWVTGVVVNIMGIVHSANGVCSPLPIIGGLAERWFAGITVAARPSTPV